MIENASQASFKEIWHRIKRIFICIFYSKVKRYCEDIDWKVSEPATFNIPLLTNRSYRGVKQFSFVSTRELEMMRTAAFDKL